MTRPVSIRELLFDYQNTVKEVCDDYELDFYAVRNCIMNAAHKVKQKKRLEKQITVLVDGK